MTDLSRRRVLAAGGLLAAGTAVGSVLVGENSDGDGPPGDAGDTPADATGTTTSADTPAGPAREDFVWAEHALWQEADLRRNLLAFAARNDLALVVAKADATSENTGELRSVLDAASDRGIPVWLNTGVLRSLSAKEFVTDAAARDRHLDALKDVAERYSETMPEGNLVLWQEAPVAGEWVKGGAWNDAAVANLESYGPAIFDAQRSAIEEVAPDLDVGVFLHFPYVIESRQPEVFADLMDALADRDARPDFAFTDFYRGWYEKDVGPGPATAAVRSLVRNARRHADAPAYFLGQAHTVNPRHTPSRASMRMDLRAALGAGASGVGWYARTVYKQTRRGFDPYIPNRAPEDAVPDVPAVNTFTVARDRYLFAYAQTFGAQRGFDPGARFDLWVHGSSLGFHDHAVSVRAADGWTFLGDVAGYVEDTYATGEDHVSAFHALDAERFVRDGTLDVRIETPPDATDGHLRGLAVVPFDPALYVGDPEATRLVAERDVAPYAHGSLPADLPLDAGGAVELSVPVGDAERPLVSLVHPDRTDLFDALAAFERREGVDPADRFDLWVAGRGAGDALSDLGSLFPDAAPDPAATATGGEAAVAYGFPREAVLGEYPSAALTDAIGRAGDGVRALYAMPYFGRDDLYTPERVAALLDDQPGEVGTYSIAADRR